MSMPESVSSSTTNSAHGGSQGDLLATVQVAVPNHLSAEARRHLEAFAAAMSQENPRDDLMIRARQDS